MSTFLLVLAIIGSVVVLVLAIAGMFVHFMEGNMLVAWVLLVLVVVFVAAAVTLGIRASEASDRRYERACTDRGGVVVQVERYESGCVHGELVDIIP